MYVKINNNGQRKRLKMTLTAILLSVGLAACESSQLLDVSGLLSSEPNKTATEPASGENESAKAKPQEEIATATSENSGEEKIVLRGPAESGSSEEKSYPSLSDQPEKPGKRLNVAEKDSEIRELEDLSKTHVENREADLESSASDAADIKKPKDDGLFGLGWLGSGKSKTPGVSKSKKGGLTPPEKLRLARTRAAVSDGESATDSISTDANETPGIKAGLRRTPIIPSVPEKEDASPPQVEVAKTTAPSDAVVKAPVVSANRPSAQNPKMVFFSDGLKKLSQTQQKPLDEIARFRDSSGSNIYVLGFSQTDPSADNTTNIDSQDMAISRANHVADGLRKRGFPSDQVVVQIIDELQEKGKKYGAAKRRVEVYFENTASAPKVVTSIPKRATKSSPLDFLKGKPFVPSESEN